MSKGPKAAVFLDRDGTINEDVGYLSDPAGLVMIEGAAASIRLLNEIGAKVIVVTNQSGVGRGYYTESDVEAVNLKLKEFLAIDGAKVDAIYYCSHHPDVNCSCRKPNTGMADTAALEHELDSSRAYVVGDKASDIGLARNLKAKGILVLTGSGHNELEGMDEAPDFIAKDLTDAVRWIISDLERLPE